MIADVVIKNIAVRLVDPLDLHIEFSCWSKDGNELSSLGGTIDALMLQSRIPWQVAGEKLIQRIQEAGLQLIIEYDEFAGSENQITTIYLRNSKGGTRGQTLSIHYLREGDVIPAHLLFRRRPRSGQVMKCQAKIADSANDKFQQIIAQAKALALLINRARSTWGG